MEERRGCKSNDMERYKILHKTIRRKVRTAYTKWHEDKCEFVESLVKKHDAFNLHKEIKAMADIKKPRQHPFLVDDLGKIILNPALVKKTWEDYVSEMFRDSSRCDVQDLVGTSTGPTIIRSEVVFALRKAKSGKSAGPDNVNIEILKLLEQEHVDALVRLFNTIYDSGVIPQDWLKSTFIAIPKKRNAKKCSEHRTISLMSHVLKLFLSIIHHRIRVKCDEQLGQSQFGFRAGMGTREAQFALNVLVQKCRDLQQDVFICFIDYEKAFDRVKHEVLLHILKSIHLDTKDIRIVVNLYWQQTASVRVGKGETKPVDIQRGVRQGCILSPVLFNLYSENIINEALEGLEEGVLINGHLINNLRYADDTVLIASSQEGLQKILNRVFECSIKAGLNMNASKTKCMSISKLSGPCSIKMGTIDLERVSKYRYLGSWMTDSWESDTEIKVRIEIARASFMKMNKVLCSKRLSILLRKRLLQCYIFPVVLYGCESWTIYEDLRKRLEAFEMWAYRRMLLISWTDKISNIEVLKRMNIDKPTLVRTIKQRKVGYLGHVLRHERYQLLQIIMMGKIDGKRGVGRRKLSWLRNIREWTGIKSVEELFRFALNKEKYQKMTADLQ